MIKGCCFDKFPAYINYPLAREEQQIARFRPFSLTFYAFWDRYVLTMIYVIFSSNRSNGFSNR